jgi:hypothetical protein
MGIRFSCPNGHHLHVKSFLAGKRGICPHCDVRFEIPRADTGRVPAFAPAVRPPGQGRLLTPSRVATAAAQVDVATALAVDALPRGELPAYGRRVARSPSLSRTEGKKGKGLVITLSLLVVVLAAVLVFVVVYFGDG